MRHIATLFLVLYAFWLVLSGHFTAFLLAAGAGCVVAVLIVSRRMRILDSEGQAMHLSWRAFTSYWPWLLGEMTKSAWDVAWRILHPRLPISPTLTRFQPSQRSDLGLVIHANSITLTPGTICIEARQGEFLVHALTAEGAAALLSSEMDRRVTTLESRR